MRIFNISFLCLSLLYGIDTAPVNERIESANAKEISFYANRLKVGESGIVLTEQQGYEMIIASAVITRIEGDRAYASIAPFSNIEQKYLPTPQASPKEGDKVIFGGFYNRAIAIAPNQESYNKILSSASNVSFSHIDLFAAFLAKDGINDPKPKHLRAFCNAYSIGLVYVFASNGINVLDCQSFAILEVLSAQDVQDKQTQAPFFSRIPNINTGSLASKLRSKKSRQYFSYYDDLLSPSLRAYKLTHKE
ncbi:plasminogen-binding protein pgbA [Helicobacter jaachi]|uniref:Plasminogen-binding protein pgbA n=1 Tax=Helicobacter jaachi TaxID=1677920 RepID=A0A4U8TF66_9HELI|nr:plasminogen-binding N-terminal domain-containing protein [Helicobacter jaachi]TLD97357.1 plasminogen-binding protein pgbA [Helicobacter jaachi]